jgi:TrmH family RNA methyltransferase
MITSLTNSKVKAVKRLHRQKGRQKAARFIVEGLRLVEEALRAGQVPALVFYTPRLQDSSRGQTLLVEAAEASARTILVSEAVMKAMSTTATPQSVTAVCHIPRLPWPEIPTALLVLDRLRDPGNLGSALRAAEAAGVEGVLLSPGTVDAFNPKVVRGGMGAHFWLSVRSCSWPEIKKATAGLDVWLAEVETGTAYDQVDWTRPWALIIGNEARGGGREANEMASGRVYISMAGRAESLNAAVAAGVILFEAARQRTLAQKSLL